jgi:hypothetical protein
MDDLERRLRAAMTDAAEHPPAGLLAGVWRRRTRHLRRVGAGCAAAVAAVAVAVPSAEHALRAAPQPGRPTAPAPGPAPGPGPSARSGTALRDCGSNNDGTMSAGWRKSSVQAGPVWFVFARAKNAWPAGRRLADGKLTGGAAVIAVRSGSRAVITVAPAARQHFRFLAGFSDQDRYSLASGWPGLTVVGCPPGPAGAGLPNSHAAGLTMFWQGYVSDLNGCLPLEVRKLPHGRPVRVTLFTGGHSCPRRP